MPYFHNNDINLLFIHIPRTGGSSLENYFSFKYKINLNIDSLYGFLDKDFRKNNLININSSLQHLTYNEILNNNHFFEINRINLNIITIVRNPYNRVISDLLFFKKITLESNQEEIFNSLLNYLTINIDNHNLPQYLFVTDKNKELIPNLTILKTEYLDDYMDFYGFIDYKIIISKKKEFSNLDNFHYLNNKSIDLINNYYEEDFKIFGYDML